VSIDPEKAITAFEAHFETVPEIITRAPGRVNIIGEHTDYNHGFVLPMAIEQETLIAARQRDDTTINAFAANLERTTQADIAQPLRQPEEPWIDYILGVVDELAKLEKPLHGADLMIIGDVPIGCGLSSSASLEMAALKLFETMGNFKIESPEAPKLGQRVENHFLGLSSGIMDQFISRMGKQGHALFLDCRSMDFDHIPVAFPNAIFVIANTCVARGLTSSKYNERVDECRQAVEIMNQGAMDKADLIHGTHTHLRDFTMDDLQACRETMPDVPFRRARHVITEDLRTKAACEAMRAGDVTALGEHMTASDLSLRDDYEVTSTELDTMTEIARAIPGCHGARMTGAGFGGCTINLIDAERIESFSQRLMAEYETRTNLKGEVFVSLPAAGASRVL